MSGVGIVGIASLRFPRAFSMSGVGIVGIASLDSLFLRVFLVVFGPLLLVCVVALLLSTVFDSDRVSATQKKHRRD
jgi:ABC-type microcin C transport system permease subunit YejB